MAAQEQTLALDLSKYIETRFFEDRPHIRGRRIPVATIAYNARTNHRSVSDLMDDYGLSEVEVLAALLYYAQNQAEVDRLEEAYDAVPIEEWIRRGNVSSVP